MYNKYIYFVKVAKFDAIGLPGSRQAIKLTKIKHSQTAKYFTFKTLTLIINLKNHSKERR